MDSPRSQMGARRARWRLAGVAALAVLAVALSGVLRRPAAPAAARVDSLLLNSSAGFARVEGPPQLRFPEALGAHPQYQTEWWYYTGNLQTAEGRRFGYQLTFFRRALAPPQDLPTRPSPWADGQVYLAHFAVTDVEAGAFRSFERLARGGDPAVAPAGAVGEPSYAVWLEDWQVRQTGERTYQLQARQDDLALELTLEDGRGIILQGDQGYSRKGPEPGNASIYFSQTRLETAGSVSTGGETYPVTGLSWMDHETSTSALSPGQVGWDWFALQLSDGSELMVFQIRREDGSVDPFSAGTYVAPDGTVTHLRAEDFRLTPLTTWTSPRSNATYPANWRVEAPGLGLDLAVRPFLADQEHPLSFVYWEGAVGVSGSAGGQAVTGSGYVEMTGYAGTMEGRF